MRYLWSVFAVLFAMMVFTVMGCQETTVPAVSPSPATPAPTTPPPAPDTECPRVVSTAVSNMYRLELVYQAIYDTWSVEVRYVGRVTVTFDEPVVSSCVGNPGKWEITITRGTSKLGPFTPYNATLSADRKEVTVFISSTLTSGDLVEWVLAGYAVCDDLGNCCCGFRGSACYVEPTCSPPAPGCPLRS
jgi:hypothetical protein